MDLKNMTEEQVLERLLNHDDSQLPTQTLFIKRLQIPVTLRALEESELERLRRKCTYTIRGKKGGDVEKLNEDEYAYAVIVKGTVSPNWADPALLEKYKASGPEQVLKKIFLPGEIATISDHILELSGYGEDAVEEIKNLSTPEEPPG